MFEVKYLDRNFKKLSVEEKKKLKKGIDNLLNKIEGYQRIGKSFDRIFNDDSVKHDIYPKHFCSTRFNGRKLSLRILYRVNQNIIEIHKVYVKKGGGMNEKRYIKIFNDYVVNYA